MFLAAGALIMGAGYAYQQFFKGRKSATNDNLDGESKSLGLLTQRLDALEKLCNSQDKQIHDLEGKVMELTLAIKERDRKIDEYMLILQNRNPQFDEFMKDLIIFTKRAGMFMDKNERDLDHVKSVTDRLLGKPGDIASSP